MANVLIDGLKARVSGYRLIQMMEQRISDLQPVLKEAEEKHASLNAQYLAAERRDSGAIETHTLWQHVLGATHHFQNLWFELEKLRYMKEGVDIEADYLLTFEELQKLQPAQHVKL